LNYHLLIFLILLNYFLIFHFQLITDSKSFRYLQKFTIMTITKSIGGIRVIVSSNIQVNFDKHTKFIKECEKIKVKYTKNRPFKASDK
jgi:hypothetical protein